MNRSPEADDAAAAMAMALQASHDRYRGAPAFSLAEAGLTAALRPAIYAEPAGPNAQGFWAVGEIQDRLRNRTGFVLLHQETNSVRISWVLGQPNIAPVADIVPTSLDAEAAEMAERGRAGTFWLPPTACRQTTSSTERERSNICDWESFHSV